MGVQSVLADLSNGRCRGHNISIIVGMIVSSFAPTKIQGRGQVDATYNVLFVNILG